MSPFCKTTLGPPFILHIILQHVIVFWTLCFILVSAYTRQREKKKKKTELYINVIKYLKIIPYIPCFNNFLLISDVIFIVQHSLVIISKSQKSDQNQNGILQPNLDRSCLKLSVLVGDVLFSFLQPLSPSHNITSRSLTLFFIENVPTNYIP